MSKDVETDIVGKQDVGVGADKRTEAKHEDQVEKKIKLGYVVAIDDQDKVFIMKIGEENPDMFQLAGLAKVFDYQVTRTIDALFTPTNTKEAEE